MLTSVAWTYPNELATPGIEKYASVVSMGSATINMILPPFIVVVMPNH